LIFPVILFLLPLRRRSIRFKAADSDGRRLRLSECLSAILRREDFIAVGSGTLGGGSSGFLPFLLSGTETLLSSLFLGLLGLLFIGFLDQRNFSLGLDIDLELEVA
jgi:hypothetical protein